MARRRDSRERPALCSTTCALKAALRDRGEGELAPLVKLKYGKSRATAKLGIAGALKHLGIDPAAAKGAHDITHKEDLIIINLIDAAFTGKARRRK